MLLPNVLTGDVVTNCAETYSSECEWQFPLAHWDCFLPVYSEDYAHQDDALCYPRRDGQDFQALLQFLLALGRQVAVF